MPYCTRWMVPAETSDGMKSACMLIEKMSSAL